MQRQLIACVAVWGLLVGAAPSSAQEQWLVNGQLFTKGFTIVDNVPSPTTNKLYNNGGTLTWNGTAVGGGTTLPIALSGDVTAAAWTTTGAGFSVAATTLTDSTTAAAGTVAVRAAHSLGVPTLAFSHGGANATITEAFTIYVPKPIAGTGAAITNANSAYFGGNVAIGGVATTHGSPLYVDLGYAYGTAKTDSDVNVVSIGTNDAANYAALNLGVASSPFVHGLLYSYHVNIGGYVPTIFGGTANVAIASALASTPPQKLTVVGATGIYNNYTASNYEGLTITADGAGIVTLAAATLGTGIDNINIIFTPAGTGTVSTGAGFAAGSFSVGATPGIDKTCGGPVVSATFVKGILTAMVCTS